ncbi:hypothetical protein [Sphingomonas sp.]
MTTTRNSDTSAQRGAVEQARDAVHDAIDKSRETASHAVDATRDTARTAAHKTEAAIEQHPIAALAGGLAIGAAIGALLPRTDAEAKHLGPLGKRISDGATAAALAARDQGKQELGALLPDKDNAKEKAMGLLGSIAQAAKEAGKKA